MRSFLFPIILITLGTTLSGKDQWLDFRGPDHNGQVENRLPEVWNEDQNVAWRTELHDHGISTPVIFDDRIVLTAATEDGSESYFLILDLKTGKVLHDKLIFTSDEVEPLGGFGINTYATPSPVSDGKTRLPALWYLWHGLY